MSNPTPLIRQEPLQTLPAFCAALATALKQHGPADDRLSVVLDGTLVAECVLCGITLTGLELLELASRESVSGSDQPKLARLRQGYCARNGCHSYFYRLTFAPHPDIDWAKVLRQTDVAKAGQPEEVPEAQAAVDAARRAVRWKLAFRVLAALALLGVLWVIRQWYTGGTIPLLREPEHFTADPASIDPRVPR